MKKEAIISLHEKVDVYNDAVVQLIGSFRDIQDMEIAAIICSWLSNGYPCEYQAMKNILCEEMNGNPYSYIISREYLDVGKDGESVICGMITTKHFRVLAEKLSECYSGSSLCIMTALGGLLKDRKRLGLKYGHNALSVLLGGGTMLPTVNANETFYRYNLMNYYLSHLGNLWDYSIGRHFLLPCNDKVFLRAHELGIAGHRMKSSLANTVALTKKARSVFGDRDFYRMYELLSSDVV